jgi:hypothetical protein
MCVLLMLEMAHSLPTQDIADTCRLISIIIVYHQFNGEVLGLPVRTGATVLHT